MLFEISGPMLEVLEMETDELYEQDIAAVSNCTSLSYLQINASTLTASLAPLWTSIGSSLRDLSVECHARSSYSMIDLHVLGATCKNLEKCRLLGMRDRRDQAFRTFSMRHGQGFQAVGVGPAGAFGEAGRIALREFCPLAKIKLKKYKYRLKIMWKGLGSERIYLLCIRPSSPLSLGNICSCELLKSAEV